MLTGAQARVGDAGKWLLGLDGVDWHRRRRRRWLLAISPFFLCHGGLRLNWRATGSGEARWCSGAMLGKCGGDGCGL